MKLTPAEIDGKLNREYFEGKLRDLLGSFNRKNLNADNFKTRVETACRNARAQDFSKTKPWPLKTGSHVYRLVEKLLKEQ